MRQLGIYLIVEKDNGSYTKRALFFQDILRYSIALNGIQRTSFKDRELTHWLLENNKELKNYYVDSNKHTPRSTRVDNRLDRVKASVKDLVELGLMVETGTTPAEKGGTRPVQLYGFTMDGHLLACLIES